MKVALTELKNNVLEAEKDIVGLKKEYDERMKVLQRTLVLTRRAYEEALQGLDLDAVATARTVLYKQGKYTGKGDQPSCVRDFIEYLATGQAKSPYKDPKTRYLGTKNYSGWSNQREDHEYGRGPKHGSTVFALGLERDARKRDLTDDERNALIYYLENIEKIEAAEAKAEAA